MPHKNEIHLLNTEGNGHINSVRPANKLLLAQLSILPLALSVAAQKKDEGIDPGKIISNVGGFFTNVAWPVIPYAWEHWLIPSWPFALGNVMSTGTEHFLLRQKVTDGSRAVRALLSLGLFAGGGYLSAQKDIPTAIGSIIFGVALGTAYHAKLKK